MKMSNFSFPHKAIIAVFVLAVIAATGYAQVNRDEMNDLPPVVFINYEGPHARVDTREEIRQLGVVLGRDIATRERGVQTTLEAMNYEQRRAHSYKFETGANNRYFIIHNVSGSEENKLNADILGLGVDTGVDHVRNLRVIIQGYLQEAYAYNASDALLLAEFITIYNAVYRGNWDFISSRYKTPVVNNLTRERAGLSIRYDEWPGRTQILIPLGRGLGAVDASAISDARVIEEMRKDDDQGIPQRQAIVNLQEREAAQAERQVQQERQVIRQEERQIAAERRQTEQERQRTSDDLAAGRITREEAQAAEEAVRAREEELAQRESDLNQRREETANLAARAEEQAAAAQTRREEIAADQQAAIAQQPTGVIGITIERQEPTTMGRLVLLNPATGAQIRRSPLDLIHTRTVTFLGGRLIAVAGENKGVGAVRLVEMNQTSLEMAKQGDDDIKTGSLLWVNGNDLYAVLVDLKNDHCFLGRFDTNLVLLAKSVVRVHPLASVTIQQGRLLSQRDNGTALLLNPMDLTEIKENVTTAGM